MKIYDLHEMMNTEFPKLVEVRFGEVGFPENNYWIELAEIKNYHDLVAWIHHLAGKTWVDGEMIAEFIEVVCEQKGWKIYGGGR